MEQLLSSEDFSSENYNIISIVDHDADWLFAEPTEKNILQLRFNDLDGDKVYRPKKAKAIKKDGKIVFNEDHAKQIKNFLDSIDTRKDLIVHCVAGISRSGAVGDFARTKFKIPFGKFMRNNPQVQPNAWIRKLLFKLEYGEYEVKTP